MPRLPHRVDARGIPVRSQQWVEHAGTPRSRHRARALPIQFHATAVTREINDNMSKTPKIIYTLTYEAPALATFSLLPIIDAYTDSAGVIVETRDISLAGRIISQFPEYLSDEQQLGDRKSVV